MIVRTAGSWINVFAVVLCATAILVLDAARSSGRSQAVDSVPAPADIWRSIFSRPDTIPSPKNNPLTKEKTALGRSLFFDKRLSREGRRNCASCHDPAKGFSDGSMTALGRNGRPLKRNTMSLWNLAWAKSFYWDGRRPSLEEQARVPIEHPNEMGGSLRDVAVLLQGDADYRRRFQRAFPASGKISAETILQAIGSFERSLVSPRTRFDQWIEGATSAITIQEYRGFQLFVGKAGCLACHGGWRFTDDRFHDIGLKTTDLGRGALASPDGPRAPRFKTPGLRELSHSKPYMHNGSMASLRQIIEHYNGGFERRASLAANVVRDLKLSPQERNDLVAFLGTLSSDISPAQPNSQRAE